MCDDKTQIESHKKTAAGYVVKGISYQYNGR